MPGQPFDARHDRRRFLRRAGAATGAAWVVPTILSGTPAAAGVASGDPCALTLYLDTSSCNPSFNYAFGVQIVDLGNCPDGATVAGYRSSDGGPFVLVGCGAGITSFNLGPIDPTSTTGQVRFDRLDVCDGTVIESFLSPVYGPCPPPGAPIDGGAPVNMGGRYTTADGVEHVL